MENLAFGVFFCNFFLDLLNFTVLFYLFHSLFEFCFGIIYRLNPFLFVILRTEGILALRGVQFPHFFRRFLSFGLFNKFLPDVLSCRGILSRNSIRGELIMIVRAIRLFCREGVSQGGLRLQSASRNNLSSGFVVSEGLLVLHDGQHLAKILQSSLKFNSCTLMLDHPLSLLWTFLMFTTLEYSP